jgi:Fis family transcriptional regulator
VKRRQKIPQAKSASREKNAVNIGNTCSVFLVQLTALGSLVSYFSSIDSVNEFDATGQWSSYVVNVPVVTHDPVVLASEETKSQSIRANGATVDGKWPLSEARSSDGKLPDGKSSEVKALVGDSLAEKLDEHALEAIVEYKISRFLDQIGTFYPQDLYDLIMKKVEKPLLAQILRRTGGNQVHAAKILGINRNTLRKKMKLFGLHG